MCMLLGTEWTNNIVSVPVLRSCKIYTRKIVKTKVGRLLNDTIYNCYQRSMVRYKIYEISNLYIFKLITLHFFIENKYKFLVLTICGCIDLYGVFKKISSNI